LPTEAQRSALLRASRRTAIGEIIQPKSGTFIPQFYFAWGCFSKKLIFPPPG
jgi:hypothetical protein